MSNGLSRLASRFLADPSDLDKARAEIGDPLDAQAAQALGLVTFALDDIDWEDEIRLFLEERASFSPDGLTGLEANLRFGGPETMESKIFARLTAWQNWIFQRPNAVGEKGALKRYGTGQKPAFDTGGSEHGGRVDRRRAGVVLSSVLGPATAETGADHEHHQCRLLDQDSRTMSA